MSIFRRLRGACITDYFRKPLGGPITAYEEILPLNYHHQLSGFRPYCKRRAPARVVPQKEVLMNTTGSSVRVFRGGGWINVAWNCRAALCGKDGPSYRGDVLGFRPAKRVTQIIKRTP